MKKVTTKKYKGSFIFNISIFVLIVFVFALLINQQITISEKTSQLTSAEDAVKEQELSNAELQYSIEQGLVGGDAFAEEYARSELNYAMQGDKVFVNIGGN
ncbi:MAG: septum formation initiator family protein [Clostridia bacterium]